MCIRDSLVEFAVVHGHDLGRLGVGEHFLAAEYNQEVDEYFWIYEYSWLPKNWKLGEKLSLDLEIRPGLQVFEGDVDGRINIGFELKF